MIGCHLCGHPREVHDHYGPSTHCSVKLNDGTWCKCGAFERHSTGMAWSAITWVAEHWPRRWR